MLMQSIQHALGFKAGLTIVGGQITEWPYDTPIPSEADIQQFLADYEYEYKRDKIRLQREPLLNEADIQIRKHADIDHVNLAEWRTYRQALRDVTLQNDLDNIQWPIKPVTLP